MDRPFRWFPAEGGRHAVPVDLVANDVGSTLCGKEVTVPRERASKTAWCWPTCGLCDAAWREREGLVRRPSAAASPPGRPPGTPSPGRRPVPRPAPTSP
ncbi:zinc finger protein [Umezawaea endophytica]|uniref:zinc finger protein n=1 Tax=Umezawaea endophytica TaxID=1654476 RepID=UPI0035EA1151